MSVTPARFAIERRYGCAPAQAYRAFAEEELKREWFGNTGWEMDFRVGGEEVNHAGSHTFRGRYHDIVENERIVFAYDLLLDDRLVSVSLTAVEFHRDGAGTRLVFTEQGLFFDGLDDPAGREHGTGKLLDALGALLEREAAR